MSPPYKEKNVYNVIQKMTIFDDLDKNYITFDSSNIRIIFDDNETMWFHLKDSLKAIDVKDQRNAVKKTVSKEYTKEKKDISGLHYGGHPSTLYIEEPGLYELLIKSRLPKAKIFKKWVLEVLIPSIRKYGKYKLKQEYEKEISEMMVKINFIEKQNKRLKANLKKNDYPEGGIVYVVDYTDLEPDMYRVGMTFDLKKRMKIYNTHVFDKRHVVVIEQTPCPSRLETCLLVMLHDHRYQNNKDFFVCPLGVIKKALRRCKQDFKACGVTQAGGGTDIIEEEKENIEHEMSIIHKKIAKIDNFLTA